MSQEQSKAAAAGSDEKTPFKLTSNFDPLQVIGKENVQLIGFSGSKYSGKSTCTEFVSQILQQEGLPVQVEAFAKTVKDGCETVFTMSNDQLYDPALKDAHNTMWKVRNRYMMDTFGECLRDYFGEHIFVACLWNRIDPKKIVIIQDVRFPNEVDCIKKVGGRIYVVAKDPADPWEIEKKSRETGKTREEVIASLSLAEGSLIHETRFDGIIPNNGTKDDLVATLRNLFVPLSLTYRVQGWLADAEREGSVPMEQ